MSDILILNLLIIGIGVLGFFLIYGTAKNYRLEVDVLCKLLRETSHRPVQTSVPNIATGGTSYITYVANTIDVIPCTDKSGKQYLIPNSPKVEIRFTLNDKKRTVMYFDTLKLENSTISGSISRFVSILEKSIELGSITKIELQKGRKRFKYINK